jgi:regulator of replication initiation timing
MSRKCFENIARKSVALESVVGKQSKNLQLNETTFHEMIEEIERLNSENDKLKKRCSEADEYSCRITEELKIMKDIAATSGMPEETLKRIHKNLQGPFKVQSDFVISLIHRLQNELDNKKHINFLDNIAHEVEILANAFEESQVREKNMFEILLEMQKRLDRTDGEFSKETNKLLRQTLLSQLTL